MTTLIEKVGTTLVALVLWSAQGSISNAAPAPAPDAADLIRNAPNGDISSLEAALSRASPEQAPLLRAQIAASRLDDAGVAKALEAYFAGRDNDPRRQAVAWSIAATSAFAAGDYGRAVSAVETWRRLPDWTRKAGEVDSMAQIHAIAAALAIAPRQSRLGGAGGWLSTRRDKIGLLRADVEINGATQAAVLDTGANLSTVSATTAKRLRLRMIGSGASVRGVISKDTPARIGVADRLTIAGVTLANVAFLVMDDRQLSFPVPGGYSIDAIIGFPVYRALGRVRFDRSGRFAARDAAGPPAHGGNLSANICDLFVLSRVNGAPTALHLDTGASGTVLWTLFAERNRALVATAPTAMRPMSGVGGGIVHLPVALLRPATVDVDGRSVRLPELSVVTKPTGGKVDGSLGTLGLDVLNRFQSYTIDFTTMSFKLGEPIH